MDSRLGEVSVVNWQGRRRGRGMMGVALVVLAMLAAALGAMMLLTAWADGLSWVTPRGVFAAAMIAPLIGMIVSRPAGVVLRWFAT